MRISVSITPIWREYGLTEAGIFEQLKQCGFDWIDYDFSVVNQETWSAAEPEKWASCLKRALSEAGLEPNLAHISGFNPLYDGERVVQAVRCAGALGVKKVVVPLGWAKDNARREYEEQNHEYLKRLLAVAGDIGVTLLIEHSGSWLEAQYAHHAIELIRMIEKLGQPPLLKVNLNIGKLGVAEIKPHSEIRLLGDRIANVDLSDNFGGMPLAVHREREDLGLAPMMGYIDYDRVMQGLKDAAYAGDFNLRMDMPRVFPKESLYCKDAPLRLMPIELTRRLHRWSLHIIQHMLKVYGFCGEEQK